MAINPLKEWEHWFRNLPPHNPTQAEYARFQQTKFELPENGFDRMMKAVDKQTKQVFRTPYLDILEDYDGDSRPE